MHKVIEPIKASELRADFIKAFVDTSTNHYKELAKIKPNDIVYDNYVGRFLYDTLYRDNITIVPFSRAVETIAEKKSVYSMWDITPSQVIYSFAPNYILAKPHYLDLYKSDTVIEWDAAELAALLEKELGDYDATDYLHNTLPEDIYVFDDSFHWCVIFEHSAIQEGERLCKICSRKMISPDAEA